MAKLDQSFIKAYGHVGLRPRAAEPNATPRSAAPAAAASLPLISTSPIVVDAGSFAIDVACGAAGHAPPVTKHRVEGTPPPQQSAAPPPHVRTPAQQQTASPPAETTETPRKGRRTPAKRSQPLDNPNAPAANFVTTFQADSFSVDAAAAELKPPMPKPTAPPKPAETRRQAPRASAGNLCHRACTVQFSTVADTADFLANTDDAADIDEIEVVDLDAELDDEPNNAARSAFIGGHYPESATRIDGVAYRRTSTPPTLPTSTPPLRTGYEVDAFRWPEVVNGLSGRATTALATLIDELIDASSIGRGVVMFAGERRGAGVTTLAAYAARRLAQLGLSVALVDADFAKPALARSLGVAVEYGWDDALEAQADFTAATIASLDDGVTMLPLRHATFGVTAARAARIAADLAVLRKHFALVILDGGPLAEVAEPWLAHAPEDTVDCGIVVRDARVHAARPTPGRTHAPRSAALPAIGIVENFVPESTGAKK